MFGLDLVLAGTGAAGAIFLVALVWGVGRYLRRGIDLYHHFPEEIVLGNEEEETDD